MRCRGKLRDKWLTMKGANKFLRPPTKVIGEQEKYIQKSYTRPITKTEPYKHVF